MGWLVKPVRSVINQTRGIEGAVPHTPVLSAWNLGGFSDVNQHLFWFRDLLANIPESKKIVLFGCSRGASTTFIAVTQMTPEEQKRIALVILEAPFDSVNNVVHESSWVPALQMGLLNTFTSYNPNDMSPLMAADLWPMTVPMAFITSNADTRVPKSLTQNLINRLRERGHDKVHHCELLTSHHAMFPVHNPVDQKHYFDFVVEMYLIYLV